MRADVVCLSHVPWAMELERPRAILRRFAASGHRVFFIETEPRIDASARGVVRREGLNVLILGFGLPEGLDALSADVEKRRIVGAFARDQRIERPYLWVYDALAMPAAQDLAPSLVVYDCIDDHAATGEPLARARMTELALLSRADLVFTASDALFEVKRGRNVSTFPLPSSVDPELFVLGRSDAHPRRRPVAGILGPIDARLDLDLIRGLAEARPELDIAFAGPRRTPAEPLFRLPNVTWLGDPALAELPTLLRTWDLGLVPWREDAHARLLLPSSALPLIAAGKPLVATRIDALAPLVDRGLVREATGGAFLDAVQAALADALDHPQAKSQRATADALLARTSWDRTFKVMMRFVDDVERGKRMTDEHARRLARRGLTPMTSAARPPSSVAGRRGSPQNVPTAPTPGPAPIEVGKT